MPRPNGKVTSAFLGGLVTLAGTLLVLIPQFPSRAAVREMVGDMVPTAVQSACQPGWEQVRDELAGLREDVQAMQTELAVWRDRWERQSKIQAE